MYVDKLKWITINIICISSIIFISIMGDKFNKYLFVLHSTNFKSIYFGFLPIYPILVGCLISLPHFVININKIGVWHFDWVNFSVMGIPAIYIAFTYLIYFSQVGNLLPTIHSQQLYIIGGVIFGNVLLSSFYKQSS